MYIPICLQHRQCAIKREISNRKERIGLRVVSQTGHPIPQTLYEQRKLCEVNEPHNKYIHGKHHKDSSSNEYTT